MYTIDKEEMRAIRRDIISNILHAVHFGKIVPDIRKAVREYEVEQFEIELKAYA